MFYRFSESPARRGIHKQKKVGTNTFLLWLTSSKFKRTNHLLFVLKTPEVWFSVSTRNRNYE